MTDLQLVAKKIRFKLLHQQKESMQDFVIGHKLLQLGDGKDTASINDSNDLNKSVSSYLFEYISLKHV